MPPPLTFTHSSSPIELTDYIIALVGGALAGFINTLAGNGSAITLPIMTEVIGLPAQAANGSNRIGVLAQCSTSSWAFYRGGKLQFPLAVWVAVPVFVGAMLGLYLAIVASNEQFYEVYRVLMLLMLIVILVKPKRWLREYTESEHRSVWLLSPLLFVLGVYGGFIQMGMGLFFLMVMVLVGHYSLTISNGMKLFVVGCYTAVVLGIFAWRGLVDWQVGGVIAIAQMVSGYLTARFAIQSDRANVWIHRLLVVVVVAAVIRMFY